MRYLPHTDAEVEAMLAAIGVENLDALFESIPEALRLRAELDLPPPLDEQGLVDELTSLQACTSGRPFLGAGSYPHHVPAVVSDLLLRGEILTAYTPYQPEVSQGTLQTIFEYQTMVCALTGLEVSNASMYDGAHAMAEAALLALRSRRKSTKVLVSRAIHPLYRRVLDTYLHHGEGEVVTIPVDDATGQMDLPALEAALAAGGQEVACVIAGYPNFFGVIEPLDEIARRCEPTGAIPISITTEAVALGLLAAPGRLGVQIAVGELGSFGNGMSFGGPSVGFFAATEKFLRQMPGRLCGATVDRKGRRGFVLTLSAREQHIRRAKATSNICTNQGLCATAATIHLALLGRHGLRDLARINWQRAHHARKLLSAAGLEPRFSGPVFNEFTVKIADPAGARRRLREVGLEGGFALSRYYDEYPEGLLLAVTEVHAPAAIQALADTLAAAPGGAA
ncbi:MAG: aminomethyl-transferring glycine dehydrogenase subunit GcvPA [Deltaproteobacteria bacterium]|nr:aminomethyl-transferring glycine dehydrogenase subunit GcvPA [Deltaproteobacteria bacterium]